jgi:hypothetical protein
MAGISDQKGSRASEELWHARLGHANAARVRQTQAATEGLIISNTIVPSRCANYGAEKITRQTFPGQERRIFQKLETVHSDVVGPLDTTSGGHKYFITFLDDANEVPLYLPHDEQGGEGDWSHLVGLDGKGREAGRETAPESPDRRGFGVHQRSSWGTTEGKGGSGAGHSPKEPRTEWSGREIE